MGGLTEASGVSGLAVMQVGEGAFGTRAVGVDDVTLVGATCQDVGSDLAERTREDTPIELVHDCVDFGFGGGDTALGVAICGVAHGYVINLNR